MKLPQLSEDIKLFLKLLNRHGVRYVVVGGIAVIYHGYPRYTGDIDIFYGIEPANIDRLFECLMEFWNGSIPALKEPAELQEPGVIIQFGEPPNRIDLVNRIDGVTFIEAWDNKLKEQIYEKTGSNGILVYILSREQLLINKQASARTKDQADFENLQ